VSLILTMILQSATPLAAGGGWAAFDRGGHCEAVAAALSAPRRGEPRAAVALRFDRSGARTGELSVRFRRQLRAGSSPILTVAGEPFLLVARGSAAWPAGAGQDWRIIALLRSAAWLKVEARDARGVRMVDHYPLAGAPTAIDAAAACAARR
jgi:hypothetical protein